MAGKTSSPSQAYYPIRIVSAQTGVNTITLRAWERRYGLITPKRTAKGHRLYTDEDIQLIKKIVTLLERGIPISQAQAIVRDGVPELEPSVSAASSPSQWQHYREQLQVAVSDFNDRQVNSIFDEVGEFFPVDVSIRLLFVPFFRQLIQDQTLDLGPARLAFFTAFLEAKMAWRLAAELPDDKLKKALIVNCSHANEVELLLVGLTLRQLGIGVTRLSGLTALEQLVALIESRRQWHAIIIQLKHCPSDTILSQLSSVSAVTGCSIFTHGLGSEDNVKIRHASLIPLGQDPHQAATNIRDMVDASESYE
ncbi:MAG: MerR family transcriptional regulator [Oceanobacter sp.]